MSILKLLESRTPLVEISGALKMRAARAAAEDSRTYRGKADESLRAAMRQGPTMGKIMKFAAQSYNKQANKKGAQALRFLNSAKKNYANFAVAKRSTNRSGSSKTSSWRNNNPAPRTSAFGKAVGAAAIGAAGVGAYKGAKYLHKKYKQWRGKESALLEGLFKRPRRSMPRKFKTKKGPGFGERLGAAVGRGVGMTVGALAPLIASNRLMMYGNSRIDKARKSGNARVAHAWSRGGQKMVNALGSPLLNVVTTTGGAIAGHKIGGWAGRKVSSGIKRVAGFVGRHKGKIKTAAKVAGGVGLGAAGLYGLSRAAGKARDKIRGYSVKGNTINVTNFKRRS